MILSTLPNVWHITLTNKRSSSYDVVVNNRVLEDITQMGDEGLHDDDKGEGGEEDNEGNEV